MSAHRVIEPIFYSDTINVVRYANNILCPFFAELTEEGRLYGVFQHGSATALQRVNNNVFCRSGGQHFQHLL
jgi:hypothetical protein